MDQERPYQIINRATERITVELDDAAFERNLLYGSFMESIQAEMPSRGDIQTRVRFGFDTLDDAWSLKIICENDGNVFNIIDGLMPFTYSYPECLTRDQKWWIDISRFWPKNLIVGLGQWHWYFDTPRRFTLTIEVEYGSTTAEREVYTACCTRARETRHTVQGLQATISCKNRMGFLMVYVDDFSDIIEHLTLTVDRVVISSVSGHAARRDPFVRDYQREKSRLAGQMRVLHARLPTDLIKYCVQPVLEPARPISGLEPYATRALYLLPFSSDWQQHPVALHRPMKLDLKFTTEAERTVRVFSLEHQVMTEIPWTTRHVKVSFSPSLQI